MPSGVLPSWIRVRADLGGGFDSTRSVLQRRRVRTVCDSAHCPNIAECWKEKAATFMLLGSNCTRHCHFCAVGHGTPDPIDEAEPSQVGKAVSDLDLRYAVVTSVTRDDLADMGAAHFAATVSAIKRSCGAKVELLIPDMRGEADLIEVIIRTQPEVIGHNLETVRRLQPLIRDGRASYDLSLRTLRLLKEISPGTLTKTSLLLGIGEDIDEVIEAMRDAYDQGVDILVLGQYLKPRGVELPVNRYVAPEEFKELTEVARRIGFKAVVSAPLARTSYRAEAAYFEARNHAN